MYGHKPVRRQPAALLEGEDPRGATQASLRNHNADISVSFRLVTCVYRSLVTRPLLKKSSWPGHEAAFIQHKCLSRVIYTKPMTSKKHVVLEKPFAEVHSQGRMFIGEMERL